MANVRLQKYKKNRIAGMNQFNAAIAAGYSRNTAIKACRIEKKLGEMSDYLQRAGLTDKKIAQILLEAIEANKVVGYLHQYKKSDKGRIEQAEPDEAVSNEFIEMPDWAVRLKAMELAAKLAGKLIDKTEHSGTVVNKIVMEKITRGNRVMEYDLGN